MNADEEMERQWDRVHDVIGLLVDRYQHVAIDCEPQDDGTVTVTTTSYGHDLGRQHAGCGATYVAALLALGARLEEGD